MGYRSDVAYIINFSSLKKRNEYVALVKAHGGDLYNALKECDVPENIECINFFQYDVKWYPSYEDVQAHTKLQQWAVEVMKEDADYKFISIGEDGAIHEDDSGGELVPYDDFYTISRIETPFNSNYKSYGEILSDSTEEIC